MHSCRLTLRCGFAISLAISAASTRFLATVNATAMRGSVSNIHGPRDSCEFVAPDSDEVFWAGGPGVLFHEGDTFVVEQKPMRYLLSVARDGICNVQAQQHCIGLSSARSRCDDASCLPDQNGDSMLSYLRSMAGGALAHPPPPQRSAVIGSGSGALAHWLLHAFPLGRVDAVDLNEDVISAAKCFGLHPSVKLRIVTGEGRRFLFSSAASAYDAIFVDAYDAAGLVPPHLTTTKFFELVAQKLSPYGGVLAMSLGSQHRPGPVVAAMQKVFANVVLGWAPDSGNQLLVASQMKIGADLSEALVVQPGSVAANLTRWAQDAGYQECPAANTTAVPLTTSMRFKVSGMALNGRGHGPTLWSKTMAVAMAVAMNL